MKKELLLVVLHAFNGERSIYGAFHILQGKKTAQSIQDTHLYSLHPYFQIAPYISREEIDSLAQELETDHFISLQGEVAKLTDQGIKHSQSFLKEHRYLLDLNGLKFLNQTDELWLKLTLFIQTFTQLSNNQTSFVPVTFNHSIQKWVKRQLHHTPQDVSKIVQQLYDECERFLATCSTEQAEIFVLQLSSPSQVGLTTEQIATRLKLEPFTIQVMHKATLHRLLFQMTTGEYELLALFRGAESKQHFSTATSQKTAQLLKVGLDIEQIMKKRGLKRSTIEDHLVELALNDPEFSIEQYVTVEETIAVKRAALKLNSFKLKDLREQLGGKLTYFQIRLALTRKDYINGFSSSIT